MTRKSYFIHILCNFGGFMNKKERNERTLNRTDATFSGRSMVEMLGVLAIIGVLSVGAISGYSRAMEKYRLNKTITGYSQLLVHLFEFRNNYIQQDNVYLASYLQKMNSVPEGMYVKGEFLYDSLGRRNRIFTREKRIVFDYFLTDVSQSGENDIEFCRLVFQNLIIPYSNIILMAIKCYTFSPLYILAVHKNLY